MFFLSHSRNRTSIGYVCSFLILATSPIAIILSYWMLQDSDAIDRSSLHNLLFCYLNPLEDARRSQDEIKCLEDMFTPNQHTFILTTAVTVSSYDLLNLYLTKRT